MAQFTEETVLPAVAGSLDPLAIPSTASGPWGMSLPAETYYASLQVIVMFGESCSGGFPMSFEFLNADPFTVAPPPPTGFAPQGIGYWRNHPEAWPVSTLTMGGVATDAAALMDILMRPARGDATVILCKHLIATKLNLAAGSDPAPVQSDVDAADAYLPDHPLGSRPKGAAKAQALSIKDALEAYNAGL